MIPLKINKQPAPEKGDFLLSEPFLADNNFSRTVIFLCEHNEEGSFGLVVNKPLDVEISSILSDVPEAHIPIHIGGPVEQNQLFYMHQEAQIEGCLEIVPDVFLGGDYNEVKELITQEKLTKENMRFYIGYTGWGKDQLQQEIDDLSWVVVKNNQELTPFMNAENDLWKELISKQGGKYKIMAEYPVNPSDN